MAKNHSCKQIRYTIQAAITSWWEIRYGKCARSNAYSRLDRHANYSWPWVHSKPTQSFHLSTWKHQNWSCVVIYLDLTKGAINHRCRAKVWSRWWYYRIYWLLTWSLLERHSGAVDYDDEHFEQSTIVIEVLN